MPPAAEKTYLAFDLGASSGRAILGRKRADGTVDLEEVHRFPNGPVPDGGGLFWDIRGLFGQMLAGMAKVADRGVRPAAIGVDTWGADFALLGEDGALVERPRCYRDGRNAGMSRRVVERIGGGRLQERTGSMFQDHASLCQFLSARVHTPEVVARAGRLVFIPDLLRWWLCGAGRWLRLASDGAIRLVAGGADPRLEELARCTDCTFASTSQMYDALRREWAVEILRELDLPAEILPPVHTGPVVVGTLGDQVRRRTGLGEVPVVAGAGHDTGAAFGICRGDDLPPPEDLVVISSGTWAILGIFVDEHLPAGTVDPLQFGYEANPDGSLRLIRNLTAGWLIEQCRKAWSERGQDLSYDDLIAAARAASASKGASAIVDPQWKGFVHPEDMPAAIGDYCRQTGQPAPQQPGEFAQVIFASLADSYARAIEQLRRMTGRTLGNVYVIGGMSRNAYLNELTAEKCRANVLAGPAEATALGNIAVQAAAAG